MRAIRALTCALVAAAGLPAAAAATRAPVDAPELAAPGPYPVGMRSLQVIEPSGRPLSIDLWYPAGTTRARRVVYRGAFPAEHPGRRVVFATAGAALTAPPARRGERYPLVVMSHGYSGTPVAMAWLAENLASKGYVVAGPHHEDPPITDATRFEAVARQRPLDVAFVLTALKAHAVRGDPFLAGLIAPDRSALIGYSMGGYAALTVAGARLSPTVAAAGPGDLQASGIRAVVAIAPFGGASGAWGPEGMAALRTPTLFIVGDHDRTVGYAPGVRTLFDQAVNAPRWLLVFNEAGHALGMGEAPREMRSRLWDLDWFEDPVWRKSRITAISAHMITAFLDLEVKGKAARAAYLNLPRRSDDGPPVAAPPGPYGRISPGGESATWKGFQRNHATGLEMWRGTPAPP